MHLSDAELAALTHGETTGAAHDRMQSHLAECAECAARAAALRDGDRETAALLRLVDHPAPRVRADAVIAAARRRPGARRHYPPIAAGIALCVAVGAAALPSSPLHRLLARVLTPAPTVTPAAQPPSSGRAAAERAGSGIVVEPGDALDVRLASWQAAGTLRIVLRDSGAVTLVSSRGEASFSLQPGRISADNRGAGESFTLTVPRRAPHVRVRVDTTVVFEKSGDSVTTVARADGAGAYVVDLAAPRAR